MIANKKIVQFTSSNSKVITQVLSWMQPPRLQSLVLS